MGFKRLSYPDVIIKPTDQAVVGTTLTNDTTFVFNLIGKKVYRIVANLFLTVDAFGSGQGLKMTLNGGNTQVQDMRVQALGIGALGLIQIGQQLTLLKDEFTFIPISDSNIEVSLDGVLRCTEPGTLIVQFAESSGTSISGAKMKQDSAFEVLDVGDFIPV